MTKPTQSLDDYAASHPIGDRLPGWRFKVTFRSPGCHYAEGVDARGWRVGANGTDEEEALERCRGAAMRRTARAAERSRAKPEAARLDAHHVAADDAGSAVLPSPPRRRVPVLALFSVLLFASLVAVKVWSITGTSLRTQLLSGLVLAMLYGWPALFTLARSAMAGPFGSSMRAAAIASLPMIVTMVLAAADALVPSSSAADMAAGIWLVCELAVVPLCWAWARMDYAKRAPSRPVECATS